MWRCPRRRVLANLSARNLRDVPSAQEPKRSRPLMPKVYGIPKTMKGELAWSWATDRLTASHNYLLTTVRPDCRPHAMVIWGIWLDNAFYLSTGATTRKAKNIAANPQLHRMQRKCGRSGHCRGAGAATRRFGNSRSGVRPLPEEIWLEARSRNGPGFQDQAAGCFCDA